MIPLDDPRRRPDERDGTRYTPHCRRRRGDGSVGVGRNEATSDLPQGIDEARRREIIERLVRVILDAASRPFTWGENDCALFAAACVEAQTGIDLGAQFRGRYDDAEGARWMISEAAGAAGLKGLVTRYLGTPTMAAPQSGDVVGRRFDRSGYCLGVVAGGKAYFLRADTGMAVTAASDAADLWQVRGNPWLAQAHDTGRARPVGALGPGIFDRRQAGGRRGVRRREL